jgi:hypothetical protein
MECKGKISENLLGNIEISLFFFEDFLLDCPARCMLACPCLGTFCYTTLHSPTLNCTGISNSAGVSNSTGVSNGAGVRLPVHIQVYFRQDLFKNEFLYGLLPSFAHCQPPDEYLCTTAKRVHILRRHRVHMAALCQLRALHT